MAGGGEIGPATFPTQPPLVIELVERIRSRCVDHRQARHAIDQADPAQLRKGFTEGTGIAEVTAGDDDPVGNLPAERFQHPEHNRLLPLQPEGIDAVDEVDAQLPGDFLDAGHGVIEVAGDLDRQRAVIERLRELAIGDLAGPNEDDAAHQARDSAVDRQRCARVAG